MPNRELEFSDKEKYVHIDPSKEALGLSIMERVHLAGLSGLPSGNLMDLPNEPISYYKEFNQKDIQEIIDKYIPESKVKVATGRKAGRSGKTFREALKFQQWKIKLTDMRDLVNEVEGIIDEVKNLNHPMYSNTAIVYLYPTGRQFLEEHYLQANLRKIQGLK